MVKKDKLSHQQFLKTDRDYKKAASAAHLIYVNDEMPGITRIKKGKGFCFFYNGQIIKDEKCLERIKKLAIPPSWSNVMDICCTQWTYTGYRV
jgi:DNA topoisomerase-1